MPPAGRAEPGLRLEVGRIGRPHGVIGEVAVTFTSDRSERHEVGAILFTDDNWTLVIKKSRPHQGRWLIFFDGINDRNAATVLQGNRLYADALPTEGNDLWVHELIGVLVVDGAEKEIGRIAAVHDNPAHELLELDGGALVPITFITEKRDGVVVVNIPDGLLDL